MAEVNSEGLSKPQEIPEILGVNLKKLWVVRLTPAVYPDVFENPELKKRYDKLEPQEGLFAVRYMAGRLTEDNFLDLARTSVSLENLLKWQKGRIYLSKAIIKTPRSRFEDPYRAETHESKKRAFVNEFGVAESDVEPDLSQQFLAPSPAETHNVDLWMNALLAWKLMSGAYPELEINGPASLRQYLAKENPTEVNLPALQQGFVALVAKGTVDKLVTNGFLRESEKETLFYPECARWLKEIVTDLNFSEKLRRRNYYDIYPFFLDDEALYPEISFWPHLAHSTLEYLVDLPAFLKKGQIYNPNDMEALTNRFFMFGNKLVEKAKQTGSLSDQDRLSAGTTNVYGNLMAQVIEYFRRSGHNSLWDRREDVRYEPDDINLPSVDSVIEQIRVAGGKGPKKSIAVRMRFKLVPGPD